MKIKKGDNVKVIIGKETGKTGVVENVFKNSQNLVIKGVHLMKKHIKPSKKNPSGGIIDINKKVNASNVLLVCPSCGKGVRVKYKIITDSKSNKIKTRICNKCHQSIEAKTE